MTAFRGGFRRDAGGAPPFFSRNYLFFCNHFEELQTVSIEVKLIINNSPLLQVYQNIIKICLKLNHLLFGRQLLYYSNTTSTVVTQPAHNVPETSPYGPILVETSPTLIGPKKDVLGFYLFWLSNVWYALGIRKYRKISLKTYFMENV